MKQKLLVFMLVLSLCAGGVWYTALASPPASPASVTFNGTGVMKITNLAALIGSGTSGNETDPIWGVSPSFGITALNIANWNALTSSQWTTDANGIEYTLGNIGINTPSIATSLIEIYSNNGDVSKPVMEIKDNSAGTTSGVLYLSTMGAKTGLSYGMYIDNNATSATAGIAKYGLYIASGSVWAGKNYGLFIKKPIGGSLVYAIWASGNTTLDGQVDINSHKIINVVDPTANQDAATKHYVDDSISGNLTKWDDLRTPVTAVKVSGVKPPTWTSYKSSEVLGFSDQAIAGNEEQIFFSIQLPHSYLEGSDIYPHIHWVPEDNTGGNVRWELTYTWADINSAFGAATTDNITAAAGTTTDKHLLSSFAIINGAGKTISSMLLCSLKRNSSNALDTYNGKSAYFIEIDFHYKMDSVGSSTELVK